MAKRGNKKIEKIRHAETLARLDKSYAEICAGGRARQTRNQRQRKAVVITANDVDNLLGSGLSKMDVI